MIRIGFEFGRLRVGERWYWRLSPFIEGGKRQSFQKAVAASVVVLAVFVLWQLMVVTDVDYKPKQTVDLTSFAP